MARLSDGSRNDAKRRQQPLGRRERLPRGAAALTLCLWAAGCVESHGGADDVPRDAGGGRPDLAQPAPLPDLGHAALALTAVTPTVGPPSGGIQLRLDGQGFAAGATVSIAGKAAAPVQLLSAAQLATTLPANPDAFGLVPVTVTLPGGATVTRGDLFAYAAAQLRFVSRPFMGATNATSLAVGDIDGDGQDDFAVTTFYAAPKVLLCMNRGSTICGQAGSATYAGLPVSVVIGDFNGDGKSDVVVATIESVVPSERQLHTFFGDGKGGLSSEVSSPLSRNTYGLVAAELTGDKNLDLVAACEGGNTCLLRGDGQGHFGGGLSWSSGSGATATVADLDGDGHQDVVIADVGAAQILVEYGDGTGGFPTSQQVAIAAGANAVAVGDVDRDHILDVVTTHKSAGTVSVVRGQGGRRFAAASVVTVGGAPESLRLADFNGDLSLDIAVSDSPARVINVLTGDGKGGFAAPLSWSGGLGPVNMVSGDFDHDRRPDLLAMELGAMSEMILLLNQSR